MRRRARLHCLCNALHANTSLTSLQLSGLGFWRFPAAGAALLGALTGHASLRTLNISHNYVGPSLPAHAVAAAALGALLAADTLTHLDLSVSAMGVEALRWAVEALRANTRLRFLDCANGKTHFHQMGEYFVRESVLPAVRANAGLRQLAMDTHEWPCGLEAVALVAARAAAD
jgi:hypothetical protein